MRAVLLLAGDGGRSASAGELGGRTGRLAAWVEGLRASGTLLGGGHIDGPVLTVRTAGGAPAVISLPGATSGEVHAWLLVSVPDMEAAVGLARSCPESRFADVRVLPVDAAGSFP
ncbi:MAG TPA: hypothetical protein VFW71_10390 [Actinomycetota bacterium]|nr:hypothetical protein [Actinomycetota bacterium]